MSESDNGRRGRWWDIRDRISDLGVPDITPPWGRSGDGGKGSAPPQPEEGVELDDVHIVDLAHGDEAPEPGGLLSGLSALGAATVTSLQTVLPRRRANDPYSNVDFNDIDVDRGSMVAAVDGVLLSVREAGPADAPLTVVLCHGYTLTMATWYFQIKYLREQFGSDIRIVCYDHRGHGQSEIRANSRSTIGQLGRDLASVIASVAPTGPIVLIGHSMGGMTVMSYARQHPEVARQRVLGVGLVATAASKLSDAGLGAILESRGMAAMAKSAGRAPRAFSGGRSAFSGMATPFLYGGSFGNPGTVSPAIARFVARTINGTSVETMGNFFGTLTRHDERAAMDVLKDIPTVIICGDRDLLTPLDRSVEIAEMLPDAQFVVVPSSGHMVMLEFPEVTNEALGELVGGALTEARAKSDAQGAKQGDKQGDKRGGKRQNGNGTLNGKEQGTSRSRGRGTPERNGDGPGASSA